MYWFVPLNPVPEGRVAGGGAMASAQFDFDRNVLWCTMSIFRVFGVTTVVGAKPAG